MVYACYSYFISIKNGIHVIGQVRKDTALYDIPERTGKRGRPGKYGDKFTPERINLLPEKKNIALYMGNGNGFMIKVLLLKPSF